MTPTITAIETEYAGYKFRSRLEARWAVAFTELRIDWEYEPQGYQLPDGTKYLPDFKLADKLFVEVKGCLDEAGAKKVIGLAAAGHEVLLLEDIPSPGCAGPDFHGLRPSFGRRGDGSVEISQLALVPKRSGWAPTPFGFPLIVKDVSDPGIAKTLPGLVRDRKLAQTDGWVRRPAGVENAYRVARQARFEHGESPRTFTRPSEAS
ncbi:MAG: hypothetical protein JWO67_3337 [Streptosporangiaceae bacterium]|nr:hypothetical protein [Streptosporangiaceae bacterium]